MDIAMVWVSSESVPPALLQTTEGIYACSCTDIVANGFSCISECKLPNPQMLAQGAHPQS